MIGMIVRRLATAIPLVLALTFLVFLLLRLTPGDFLTAARADPEIPAEYIAEVEARFGLDQPWTTQYLRWLANISPVRMASTPDGGSRWVFGPDFGYSWTYKLPVSELLATRVPATLGLAVAALLASWLLAIPLGLLAARYGGWMNRGANTLAYVALSVPEFVLALLAVFLAARSGWFPVGGMTAIDHAYLPPATQVLDFLHHLILPATVLALGSLAGLLRVMRAQTMDFLHSDFVLAARARGLSERRILFKHVLRNALNPMITTLGFALSMLLSGALLVENVMNYPGLGQLLFQAFLQQDPFVVMAAVLIASLMLVVGNLIADILLAVVDPRIRHGASR